MNDQKIAVVGIVEYDDKVLIGKKKDKNGSELEAGTWHIPGGKVNLGESPEAAIQREIKEESDLDVEVINLIDERLVPELNLIVKWFVCRALSGNIIPGDDLIDAKFVLKQDLRSFCSERAIALWPSRVSEYLV